MKEYNKDFQNIGYWVIRPPLHCRYITLSGFLTYVHKCIALVWTVSEWMFKLVEDVEFEANLYITKGKLLFSHVPHEPLVAKGTGGYLAPQGRQWPSGYSGEHGVGLMSMHRFKSPPVLP